MATELKSRRKFNWKKVLLYLLLILILPIIFCNLFVVGSTFSQLIEPPNLPSEKRVVLVLGTSKFARNGNENYYFKNRIKAATDLYFSGRASHFILSGDNSLSYYNEPKDMKKEMIRAGIPDSLITLDYAGFRTFDSVVRAKEVFGQDKIIIVSQKFHLYRALFIAKFKGIQAEGFAANAVGRKRVLIQSREILARCLAVVDIFILREKPRFLGEKIKIKT